ncbi:uncharacterized protein [Pseudorasbora parva]|uniref:uncharacterized protein n=1 Tax=Pseudorasbora parva TaxID=51549 RepID=UPI00351E81A5
MSRSTRAAGGSAVDPTGVSDPEAFPAAEEYRPMEKQKKRKERKGMPRGLCQIGNAIKRRIFCCDADDKACSDPTDDQPDSSSLQWPLSADPCPSDIELPVNANMADPEPSPVPGPSARPAFEKQKKKISVFFCRKWRAVKRSVRRFNNKGAPDSFADEPVARPDPADLMRQTDPEPTPVPSSSALDSGIPGPSGLGPAFEKQKKRKKRKGMPRVLRQIIGNAIKRHIFCSDEEDKADPCPSGVNADTPDLELPSDSEDLSSPELSSDSDLCSLDLPSVSDISESDPELSSDSDLCSLKLLSVSDISSPELSSDSDLCSLKLLSVSDISESDPELSPVPGPSIMELMPLLDESSLEPSPVSSFCINELTPEVDPADPEPSSVPGPSIMELMPLLDESSPEPSPVSSFSIIELTPEVDPADPEPSSVPGPSALDSGIPGPSGLGPAFVFDLWFGENQTKRWRKKTIRAFLCRRWRAVKRSVRRFQVGNKMAPESFPDEPVARQDTADPDPSPVPGPSTLDSGITPAVALDQCSIHPRVNLSWLSAYPVPYYHKRTSESYPDDPEPTPVPGPSDLVPVAEPNPNDSQSGSVSLDSQLTLDSGSSESAVLGSSSCEETYVSSLSSLELTPDMGLANPEPKPVPGAIDEEPVPGPSGFWPATGSISSFYEVKKELGRGGFGIVYEGTRRFDGQKVAIKFLPKSSWDKFIELPGSTKPLLAEVAVNLLMRKPPKSPHVVQMLDWFDEPRHYVLIMEYPHPCETLLRFAVRKGGFLDETVARGLMRQAVLAAKFCIDRGVYHKDIKTDNILVNTETLQLKFIDFGCSEFFKTSKGHEWVVESTVWSLGRVLLEIVSGDQSLSVLQSGKLDPLRPSLSKECQDLIKTSLDKYQCKNLSLEQMLDHAWFKQD